jgi:hypothetical protein
MVDLVVAGAVIQKAQMKERKTTLKKNLIKLTTL